MKKLGRVIRRDSFFYGACILILGIATVFTDNSLYDYYTSLKEKGQRLNVRTFNVSRYRALKLAKKYDHVINYSSGN